MASTRSSPAAGSARRRICARFVGRALSAVRRLVTETPPEAGVLIAGRGHYFASQPEMLEALGAADATVLQLQDFDADQARQFLQSDEADLQLPEWLPTRPLLLSHLLSRGLLLTVAGLPPDIEPAAAWRGLLDMIAQREAKIYASVPPTTIGALIRRLATTAKAASDGQGRLGIDDLQRVFEEVSGRSTDEEVLQLLLRLPGLALAESSGAEFRLFADNSLAAAAYGEDLAEYLVSPYQGHPLCDSASWSDASEDLAIEVAALALMDGAITARQVLAACDHRMAVHQYDAVLMDAVRVVDEFPAVTVAGSYLVEGVSIGTMTVGSEAPAAARTHVRDSLIEILDFAQAESDMALPTFERCLVAQVEGVAELPSRYAKHFIDCQIESFSAVTATTAGILALPLGLDDRVGLSILHKVYAKRGAGRKDSALPRGLEPAARERVPDVVAALVSAGLLTVTSRGSDLVYRPTKGRRGAVADYLAAPASLTLASLTAVR